MTPDPIERKVLRLTHVLTRLSIAKSTLYDWLDPKSPRYDPSFPQSFRLGQGSVGWLASEVDAWLLERIEAQRETSNNQESRKPGRKRYALGNASGTGQVAHP